MKISKQEKDFYKSFSQHGTGNALVQVPEKDIVLLIHIAYLDIEKNTTDWMMEDYVAIARKGFYNITSSDIQQLQEISIENAIKMLRLSGGMDATNIIYLYLKNLSALYRRRYKFSNILATQQFPQVEQIGPRSLLEYGNCENELLFTWMQWRKWIYDVDNRSAQETGYLFEPILLSCVGGESISHKNSPIKRLNENDEQTSEGRQIDCYIEENREAYELKLRVTIAASGQGRFKEEMTFPKEAKKAGITPVLIVFDPTPSSLLDKLKSEYQKHGGKCLIGDDAWDELISKAGTEMGLFIEKYVEPPIKSMSKDMDKINPQNVSLKVNLDSVTISDDLGKEYIIPRK